jgi:hypothetical protein
LTDTEKEKRVETAKIHLGKIKKRSVLFYDETSTSHQLETRRYFNLQVNHMRIILSHMEKAYLVILLLELVMNTKPPYFILTKN